MLDHDHVVITKNMHSIYKECISYQGPAIIRAKNLLSLKHTQFLECCSPYVFIVLKNGEMCNQQLNILQGRPHKKNTIFSKLKQM